ncbi:MAG: sigma-70 family RNA polymerase sigma factor [Alphaproteobacteria bacterium]|nr:MAG: sigma-70 family RNA polymerase sigma factor [Alphaproteobacteria bacterium]
MPLFRTHRIGKENTADEDVALVKRLRSGDDFALNEIMHRYKERVYRLAWRYMGNEDSALDVTQETFTKLYFNIDKYDSAYKFSTWVFQIAVNLCRDHLRKNKNHARNISLDALNESGAGDWQRSDENIEAGFLSRQQLTLLQKEIDLLSDTLKEAFILFAVEERTQVECAAILNVSAKTVETRVYRARKILSEKLQLSFEG